MIPSIGKQTTNKPARRIVHWRRTKQGILQFEYNGIVWWYALCSVDEAYKAFKRRVGIKRAKLVEEASPIIYGENE